MAVPRPSLSATELTVGKLSARSGVSVSALHFYESKGLIRSRRTAGNQRRYTREMLRRIAVIRVAQRVGVPLDTIAATLAELPQGRTPNREDWARMSRVWQGDLNRRIEQLVALRDGLEDCIGCGCLSVSACPLTNAYDRLAKEGPGPRLLLREGNPAGGPGPGPETPETPDAGETSPPADDPGERGDLPGAGD